MSVPPQLEIMIGLHGPALSDGFPRVFSLTMTAWKLMHVSEITLKQSLPQEMIMEESIYFNTQSVLRNKFLKLMEVILQESLD